MLLDPAGLLVWPQARMLAVADLHLEKGSAGARTGSLLPPWDSTITLERLAAACASHRPSVIVAVGDSFHDGQGAGRLSAADRARLAGLAEGRRMIWVAGNHDPLPALGVPGEAWGSFSAGPLLFRHEARAARNGDAAGMVEVCGHHHPKARVATRGGAVSRPCFVACASGGRLMLPAFGAYTGGLDVSDPAIGALFPAGGRVWLTGARRLFGFELS
jgi:DNA ligase-associated metallophosphoesterase